MRRALAVAAVALSLAGCQSAGADWATADFNKYGRNYAEFPTGALVIGTSEAALRGMFGENMKAVEAGPAGTVYSVDRWVSVAGPDYIGERLYLNIQAGRLASWKVGRGDTVTVVPRTW